MTAGLSDVASSSSSGQLQQQQMPGPSGSGGQTPSPAPPIGASSLSPASSIHSHIYSSANITGLPTILPVVTTTEHIYSYARKPTTATIAPSQISPRTTGIYSTIGSNANKISDDIGLPPIPQNTTYRMTQQSLHLHAVHHHGLPSVSSFQPTGPKENPYGISTSQVGGQSQIQSGSGHVRLLNSATDSTGSGSGGSSASSPHHHLHHPRAPQHEILDNSRNESRDDSQQINSSTSRLHLLANSSNQNTDSSNGSNHDSDAAV